MVDSSMAQQWQKQEAAATSKALRLQCLIRTRLLAKSAVTPIGSLWLGQTGGPSNHLPVWILGGLFACLCGGGGAFPNVYNGFFSRWTCEMNVIWVKSAEDQKGAANDGRPKVFLTIMMRLKEKTKRQTREGLEEPGCGPLILQLLLFLWVSITSVDPRSSLGITSLLDLLEEC